MYDNVFELLLFGKCSHIHLEFSYKKQTNSLININNINNKNQLVTSEKQRATIKKVTNEEYKSISNEKSYKLPV